MNHNRILIIEDDATIRAELKTMLEKYGYSVAAPDDFTDIANTALTAAPNLILLDLGLPYHDGHRICREIRKSSLVPIIVVTSRNTETDELMSLHLGADDFVAKPYNTQILLTRIENVMRRAYCGNQAETVITVEGVSLNPESSTLSFDGQTEELTKNETRILTLLMKNRGKIISRDRIMTELWQSDEFVDDNTLTVNVNRLRKKLAEIGMAELIQTKRGQGYMI
jgi:DNA-binding response OmpR family regulator